MKPRTPSAIAAAAALCATGLTSQAQVVNERTRSFFVDQIHAGAAYRLGARGQGVTVAVLDTGLNRTHPEFAGRVRGGRNFTGIGAVTASGDGHGHGTHVAGLIAAARNNTSGGMMGVAYGATILPLKVLRNNGSGTTAMSDAGLRFAIGRAQIANMSLGSSVASDPAAMQAAVAGGLLVVAAAGNDGQANPGWPARFAKESWANDQIIAVGAVDRANAIASFSNRAGDTAAWYVVAPGVNLLSTWFYSGYKRMSGTSMAAPVVSGAAALVKSRWPQLTAAQVANILFVTATDLGDPGIDAVYGRGLIDVDAAMQPVGNVTTTTFAGTPVKVLDTSVEPTPALGGLWQLAVDGHLGVVGFDDYGRDFGIDLAAAVAPRTGRGSARAAAQAAAGRRLQLAERRFADGSTWTAAWDRRIDVRPADAHAPDREAGDVRLLGLSMAAQGADGRGHAFGIGLADRHLGLAALPEGHRLVGVPALADPVLALAPQAAFAALTAPFIGGRVRAGWLDSLSRNAMLDQFAAGAGDRSSARAAKIEFDHRIGPAWASVGLSAAREHGRVLGAQGRGALALGDTASTSAVQVGASWAPAPGWVAAARMSFARFGGVEEGDRLLRSMSPQRLNGWGVALDASDRLLPGDRITLSLSQPLRASSGTVELDAVTGVDADGHAVRARQTLSMVPEGRELLFDLGYSRPMVATTIGGQRLPSSADISLGLRKDAGHVPSSRLEPQLQLRWQSAL